MVYINNKTERYQITVRMKGQTFRCLCSGDMQGLIDFRGRSIEATLFLMQATVRLRFQIVESPYLCETDVLQMKDLMSRRIR